MHFLKNAGKSRMVNAILILGLAFFMAGCPGSKPPPSQPRSGDTAMKASRCCPDSLYPGQIKLWSTVYLREKAANKTDKFDERIVKDLETYKAIIEKYVDSINKVDSRSFKVAFKVDTLRFTVDGLHVKLEIYLKHPRFKSSPRGFDDVFGQIQPPKGDSATQQQFMMQGPVHPPKCPPDVVSLEFMYITAIDCSYTSSWQAEPSF